MLLGDQPVRLLSVHLKSFCHQDDLDNVLPTSNSDCGKLKRQIPILEGWIENRAAEGVPAIVLGDFNRRFNIAGDDMWSELDDGDPTVLVQPGSFAQLLFMTVDPGGQAHLSDHCPISVVLESIGTADGDAIAVLVERLDAVQAELQEIRDAVSALRE